MNVWGVVPILLVLVFFIGLFALGPSGPSPTLYWMVGIFVVIFLPTVLIVSNCLQCPNCRGTLGPTVPYGVLPIYRLPKKVTHCPLCGLNLDEELKDKSAIGIGSPLAGTPSNITGRTDRVSGDSTEQDR